MRRATTSRRATISHRATNIAAAILLAAASAITGFGPAAAQSMSDVEVQDNQFAAPDVTVAVGDTVQWTQTGSNPHTVTAADGSFNSHPGCPPDFAACMGQGDTFSQTFDAEGTFTYYCKVHGTADGTGMAGTITVAAAGEPAPPAEEQPTVTQEPTVTGALAVDGQSGDGTSVRVASVTITGASGFVVIHADGGGSPGAVIGHAAIPEGTSTGVTVPLDAPLSASATVFPMLHLDAGTVGTYEFPGADGPVMDAAGVITFPISYTVEAPAPAPAETPAPAADLPATGPSANVLVLGILALAAVGFGAAFLRRREA